MVRGHRLFALLGLLIAAPLAAQQTTEQRVQQLEQRLDDLTREVAKIRQEIDALKAAQPSAEEDLTRVGVVAPPSPPPASQPDLTNVQTVNNILTPGASKVFNPDISVIGNFLGKTGQANPYEFGPDDTRPPLSLDESEMALQAFVDPYAKANFFLSLTHEGIEVEEGYAQFVTLPYGLTAKVGKIKSMFGKDNTWHTHVRPWADQPLVIHNFFGDEGLADEGISVSKAFSNPWNVFLEGTGEVFSGNVGSVFQRRSINDLFYNAHLKAFRDITESSNLEVGTSFARGTLPDGRGGHNQFAGIDVTYRWRPLMQGLYRSFIGRMEAIVNDRGDSAHRLMGFYASADRQLAQRWYTGLRIDASDRAVQGPLSVLRVTDRGAAATITFWPSEFSQIRGQLRRIRYGDARRTVNEFLMQLQFAIGAHGAHTF